MTGEQTTGEELFTDDVEGTLQFDFRSDDDGAVTAGDQYGIGIFSDTSSFGTDSFLVYAEATAFNAYSVFAETNGNKTELASFSTIGGFSGDWITVSLDYELNSEGTIEFSSEVNGIFNDSGASLTGAGFPQNTSGQVMTLSEGLTSAANVNIGLFGSVAANPNTAHGSLDNVAFSATAVPEPSTGLLALLASGLFFRRKRS